MSERWGLLRSRSVQTCGIRISEAPDTDSEDIYG